jgi:quercetin dioxygenase-like cupin family protein
MNSVKWLFAGLVLLFESLPATAGTQAVDKKLSTVDGATRAIVAALVKGRRVNAASFLEEGTPGASSPSKVAYFSSEEVAAASSPDSPRPVGKAPNSKRGNLYDWKEGDNSLAVRITLQEKRESAQVHEFRHVIYVLEGSATVVTGGTVVDAKTVETFTPWGGKEIRGPSIDGGETYHVSKGDVITVPKGVPHWWKEVTNPPLVYLAINFVGAQGHDSSAEPGVVTYFDSEKVAASFAKGGMRPDGKGGNVLFDGKDVGNKYRVYTVRRDGGPWEAEVHALDSDVVFVKEGTATFVTGGTVVAPKTTEPGEIRGTAIQGGVSRHLSKGDLIIVPHGTPLWYKEARGPFLFLLVKIR